MTGTPGTGKTTTARALAKKYGYIHINLSQLIHTEHLYTEVDKKRNSEIADTAKVEGRLNQLISKSKKPVLVEGHIADLTPQRYVKRVLVLRLAPDELRERLTDLGWKKDKVRVNVAAEILDSCLITALQAFKPSVVNELDATDLPKRRIVELAYKIFQGELTSPVGQVTWLKQIEAAGRVEEYL